MQHELGPERCVAGVSSGSAGSVGVQTPGLGNTPRAQEDCAFHHLSPRVNRHPVVESLLMGIPLVENRGCDGVYSLPTPKSAPQAQVLGRGGKPSSTEAGRHHFFSRGAGFILSVIVVCVEGETLGELKATAGRSAGPSWKR